MCPVEVDCFGKFQVILKDSMCGILENAKNMVYMGVHIILFFFSKWPIHSFIDLLPFVVVFILLINGYNKCQQAIEV